MAYTPTVWKNGEAPAINAENLNNIEQGIAGADSMASQALEAAGNVAGEWTKMIFSPENVTVIKDDCYFNQKLKIAYFNLVLTGTKIDQLTGLDNVDVGTFTNWPAMNCDTLNAMFYLTASSAGANTNRQLAVPVDAYHFDKFNISKNSKFPYTGIAYTTSPRFVSVTGIALLS